MSCTRHGVRTDGLNISTHFADAFQFDIAMDEIEVDKIHGRKLHRLGLEENQKDAHININIRPIMDIQVYPYLIPHVHFHGGFDFTILYLLFQAE